MVLLEQFASISSAIDFLIPLIAFLGIAYDMRNRVFKRAEKKAAELDDKVFNRENKNSIINKIDDIDKKVNESLIQLAHIEGELHKH